MIFNTAFRKACFICGFDAEFSTSYIMVKSIRVCNIAIVSGIRFSYMLEKCCPFPCRKNVQPDHWADGKLVIRLAWCLWDGKLVNKLVGKIGFPSANRRIWRNMNGRWHRSEFLQLATWPVAQNKDRAKLGRIDRLDPDEACYSWIWDSGSNDNHCDM